MALSFREANNIKSTSDEAKIELEKLDKTLDGIIDTLTKKTTDLHDFVDVDFEGIDDIRKLFFEDGGDGSVLSKIMNQTCNALLVKYNESVDKSATLKDKEAAKEIKTLLKNLNEKNKKKK